MLMATAWVDQWLGFVGQLQWLWVSVVVVVGCGGDGVVAGFGMILGSGFLLMGFYFYFDE